MSACCWNKCHHLAVDYVNGVTVALNPFDEIYCTFWCFTNYHYKQERTQKRQTKMCYKNTAPCSVNIFSQKVALECVVGCMVPQFSMSTPTPTRHFFSGTESNEMIEETCVTDRTALWDDILEALVSILFSIQGLVGLRVEEGVTFLVQRFLHQRHSFSSRLETTV